MISFLKNLAAEGEEWERNGIPYIIRQIRRATEMDPVLGPEQTVYEIHEVTIVDPWGRESVVSIGSPIQ